MPETEDIVRLRHMLDSARRAAQFTETCRRADLDKDDKLALALVRCWRFSARRPKTFRISAGREIPRFHGGRLRAPETV